MVKDRSICSLEAELDAAETRYNKVLKKLEEELKISMQKQDELEIENLAKEKRILILQENIESEIILKNKAIAQTLKAGREPRNVLTNTVVMETSVETDVAIGNNVLVKEKPGDSFATKSICPSKHVLVIDCAVIEDKILVEVDCFDKEDEKPDIQNEIKNRKFWSILKKNKQEKEHDKNIKDPHGNEWVKVTEGCDAGSANQYKASKHEILSGAEVGNETLLEENSFERTLSVNSGLELGEPCNTHLTSPGEILKEELKTQRKLKSREQVISGFRTMIRVKTKKLQSYRNKVKVVRRKRSIEEHLR